MNVKKTCLLVSAFVLCFILAIGGTYGTIYYYGKYRNYQSALSIYIDECQHIRGRLGEAEQLVSNLEQRNRGIARDTTKILELISRK